MTINNNIVLALIVVIGLLGLQLILNSFIKRLNKANEELRVNNRDMRDVDQRIRHTLERAEMLSTPYIGDTIDRAKPSEEYLARIDAQIALGKQRERERKLIAPQTAERRRGDHIRAVPTNGDFKIVDNVVKPAGE